MSNNPHTVLFVVVTIAFLVLAGLMSFYSNDPAMHTLAATVIAALLGMWVPSPVQAKGGSN